jgi:hypothetical protein
MTQNFLKFFNFAGIIQSSKEKLYTREELLAELWLLLDQAYDSPQDIPNLGICLIIEDRLKAKGINSGRHFPGSEGVIFFLCYKLFSGWDGNKTKDCVFPLRGEEDRTFGRWQGRNRQLRIELLRHAIAKISNMSDKEFEAERASLR